MSVRILAAVAAVLVLSPAVVGNFWTFLYQPQIGLINYTVELLTGTPAGVGSPKQTFLSVGDQVDAEIEGIGRLSVTIQPSR